MSGLNDIRHMNDIKALESKISDLCDEKEEHEAKIAQIESEIEELEEKIEDLKDTEKIECLVPAIGCTIKTPQGAGVYLGLLATAAGAHHYKRAVVRIDDVLLTFTGAELERAKAEGVDDVG